MAEEKKTKKKGKARKIILIILAVLLVLLVLMWTVGSKILYNRMPGNADQYDLENVAVVENSPLEGKDILFLGSSVTYGLAANGVSFADYFGTVDGVDVTKEAVSGTTLTDEWSFGGLIAGGSGKSYVDRLVEEVDPEQHFDAVVVQVSTNDATYGRELGEISESKKLDSFDTKTITGAMEYIIAYSQKTWNCPVIFYTGTYFDSPDYAKMVDRTKELSDKWGTYVIDLFNDKELNDITEDQRKLYILDDNIHPTEAGYYLWWYPTLQENIYQILGETK